MSRFTETTYRGAAHLFTAVHIAWSEVEDILGHKHNGTPEDDEPLVAAVKADGYDWADAPDTEGWVDEYGWGLIGPCIPDDD